jgi:hypothetical protein
VKGKFQAKKPTNPALMYVSTFQSKQDGSERTKYKLIIRGEVLAGLEADEKGNYTLIGFPNDFKQEDKDPDVRFKADEPKPQQNKPAFGKRPAPAKRAPVQQQVEETEEAGDDEGEDGSGLPF